MLRRRRLTILLVAVAVSALLLAGAEGLRRYASTRLVGGLADLYQGKVEADVARAGWKEADLDGVRFFDADGEHIVLDVERLQMGLTLWDLISGKTTPSYLVLTKPKLRLRFDDQGELLTRLPGGGFEAGTFPNRIDIHEGAVVLKEPQRNPLEIDGISAVVTATDLKLHLAGDLQNQRFGDWTFDGQTTADFHDGSIDAAADRVRVTPELLRQLPFVPRKFWEQVTFTGDLQAKLTARLKPDPGEPRLKADAVFDKSVIAFPALGVELDDASAKVTIRDAVVDLSDVRGSLYGGAVTASGELDLGRDPFDVRLDVGLNNVELAKLPDDWSIPADTWGQLSGKAKLNLTIARSGDIEASGEGRATIDRPVIAGVPAEPIEITLQGEEAFRAEGGSPQPAGEMTFDLRLREAAIERLLERIAHGAKVTLPEVSGTVSTDLHVSVPLATAQDAATYRVCGDIRSPSLQANGLELTRFTAKVGLSKGSLAIRDASAWLPDGDRNEPGWLSGSADIGIFPRGDVALNIAVHDAPLAVLAHALEFNPPLTGFGSVAMHAAAPLIKSQDPLAWHGVGQLLVPAVAWDAYSARDVAADLFLEGGLLQINNMQGTALGATITADAEVCLQAPFAFEALLHTSSVDAANVLAAAQITPPKPISAELQASGQVSGTLQPLVWDAFGEASAEEFVADQWKLQQARARWQVNSFGVVVHQATAALEGGSIEGELWLPFAADDPWNITANWEHLPVKALAQELPGELPATGGNLNGGLSLSGTSLQASQGKLKLHSDEIEVAGLPAADLLAEVKLKNGVATYTLSSDLLSGKLSLRGETALSQDVSRTTAGAGEISIANLSLARVGTLLGAPRDFPLSGDANLKLEFAQGATDAMPAGKGRITLSDVRWRRQELAPQIFSEVTFQNGEIEISDLFAEFGTGSVQASIGLTIFPSVQGRFSLVLDRIPSEVVNAFLPGIADAFDGAVDAQLRGTFGERVAGSGAIGISKAKVSGIEATSVRVPVQFVYRPAIGRGEMKFSQTTLQLGQGRISGSATLAYDRGFSFNGKLQLTNVALKSLAPRSNTLQSVGAGRVSGRATFSADRFRSLDDLSADFDLKLAQTRAQQVPVLADIAPILLPNVPSASSFREGTVRGRLAAGVAHIRKFTLEGNDARVLADGTITLDGRLNLNVLAMTGGNPLGRGLLRRLALSFVQAETVPLTLLTRANALLADQLVYLRVGGTIHSPSVQVRAAPQLEYEAVRFFMVGAAGGLR